MNNHIKTLERSMYRYMNSKMIIIMIMLIAAFLRIYKLASIPPHLTPDEASLGYNAFSILKTGRDEYGELLPIIFRSFGDYKPGFYVYLAIPFVAIFGLTEYAVRLPSAITGITSVYLIYKIINCLLLINKKKKKSKITHLPLAIIASFLLAINPWHIHFSRGAWEANLSLTFTLIGIYFFLKFIKHITSTQNIHKNSIHKHYLLISSLFFALTFITYQGAKLSTGIVMLVLTIVFWTDCKKLLQQNLRTVIISTVLGIIIISPVILSFFTGQTGRLEVYSVFSYPRPSDYLANFLDQGGEKVGDLSYYFFHSETINFLRGVFGRYFNHFSARFLFFEGDWQNPRHSAPSHGMMLIFDMVLLTLGFISLIKRSDKISLFIFLWLLLAPLPAALSRDQVQAVRSMNMIIPLVMVSSFGLYQIIQISRNYSHNYIKASYFGGFLILFLGSFIYYLDAYFVHLPIKDSSYWHYGYKQVFASIDEHTRSEDTIIFQQSFSQPYIFYLFFNQIDPLDYQPQAKLSESGVDVGLVPQVNNIQFIEFSWPPPAKLGDVIIGNPIVIPMSNPNGYEQIDEIVDPEGKAVFRIIRKE